FYYSDYWEKITCRDKNRNNDNVSIDKDTITGYVRAIYEAAKVNADGVEDIVADMLKVALVNFRRKGRSDRQLYFEERNDHSDEYTTYTSL
ncbi:hypothetical protein ANCCAN_29683, partial [Ancylostoma caninum]